MAIADMKHLLVGHPLANQMVDHQRIPKWKALAILSSDALSSVAYATEEILIPLAAISVAFTVWTIPIALSISALLIIITLSYRQTISCYPSGGGTYIVAKENLGTLAGLTAGASLLIDYVLTTAVSVSGGIENLSSALPFLRAHKVACGILVITFLMVMNLRGVKESASAFALPTYFFIASVLVMIVVGAFKFALGYHASVFPVVHETYPAISMFLLLRAFSSGCAALSGIEAISNGIPIFKSPSQKNAKITLVWMSLILGFFFLSITVLAHLHGIVPHAGETTISLLARAVFGASPFYYLLQFSTALILVLAANTSYADFPRLASLLARDRFLPRQFADLGDRLVFSNGIIGLSLAAMALLVIFRGDTHHLIPLYAIGVFLSFTLSQAGMTVHHLRVRGKGYMRAFAINLFGAMTTGIVLLVIGCTKFMSGAWMVVVLIPFLVFTFRRIQMHYLEVGAELSLFGHMVTPVPLEPLRHTVVMPVSGMNRGVLDAIRYGMAISRDVRACYIEVDAETTERMSLEWSRWVKDVPLIVLQSPYRAILSPILNYIDSVSKDDQNHLVTVLIPELVSTRWWHNLLHHHRALLLRMALLFKRGKVVTSVRYYLKQS